MSSKLTEDWMLASDPQLVSLEQTRIAQDLARDVTEPRSFTFGELLALLRSEKRTLLISGVAGFALLILVSFFVPLSYTATASFLPPGSNNSMSSAAAMLSQLSALGGSSLLGSKGQGDLYAAILKSHTVEDELIGQFHLMQVYKVKKLSLAEKALQKSTVVTVGTKDPLVSLEVTDHSPERARDLANGYLHAMQKASADLALTESSQRRLFYEQRLAKEKNDLSDSEVALKQTQEKSGLIVPAGQAMSQIQTQAQLQAQITQRQVRLAALLRTETEENPDVVQLHDEISSLQGQLNQLEKGSRTNSYGQLSTAAVPALELDYLRKARDVKYHEALFEIIAKQYEMARLDEAKESPLQVLDWASTPDTKSGPHRSIYAALGLFLGLISGVALILYRATRSHA